LFDLVYSVGVIQHLPNPEEGFSSLVTRLQPGGRMFVWVYGRRRGLYRLVDVMRKLTTRMAMPSLHRLTWGLNLLSYATFCLPYRALRRLPGLAGFASRLPFTRYADLPLRVGHADWFDRLAVPSTVYFQRQDVESWFDRNGLAEVQISSRDGIGWRALGSRTDGEGPCTR
jgi:SAM-dependent methyltransferase